MAASESDYDRLVGEVGVGLFMTDWRIQQRVNEIEVERRDLSKADVFLLVFWRETEWREETKARAAIVALEMSALRRREDEAKRARDYVVTKTEPFAWVSKVGADGSVARARSGRVTPDVLTGDALDEYGLVIGVVRWVEDNGGRETDAHYRSRLQVCWAEKNGSVAKPTPDPGPPAALALTAQERSDFSASHNVSGFELAGIGIRYGVQRDNYGEELEVTYRQRIHAAIMDRARLGNAT